MKAKTMSDAVGVAIHNKLKLVNTAIPGYFLKFDPATQLAEIQVSIERVNVNGEAERWSPIIQCPVHFTGCDFVLEHQIDIGAEGLIIFSQRCIDAWVDQGGVAPNPVQHFHDSNDAMFIPGIRSQPNKITSFSNDGMRLRNKDGSNFIWLKSDGTAEITVSELKINGNVTHKGDTNHTGSTTQTGDVTQTGDNNVTGTVSATVAVNSPSFGGMAGGGSAAEFDEATINGIKFTTHTHPISWTDPAGSGNSGAAQ